MAVQMTVEGCLPAEKYYTFECQLRGCNTLVYFNKERT